MKKYTKLIIGALLIWNTVLTVQYLGVKSLLDSMDFTGEVKTIRTVVTEFETDVTEVVADHIDSVVAVSNFYMDELVSSGSGAIYSKEGNDVYIVTNYHVINGASPVTVTFASGEEMTAVIVGKDIWTDLALLKVTVDVNFNVPSFTLGDSSLVKTGEVVLAIGSPIGLDFSGSVTMGIISGKDRIIPVDLDKDGTDDWDNIYLQTDAAINLGNSGGPLINMAGELIGITSMKFSESSIEGMGFAIPINEVVPIIEQLKAEGAVIRPVIGFSAVDIKDLTKDQKKFYGINLSVSSGIVITSVTSGSPASRASLKALDVITQFNGISVSSFKDYRKFLYGKKVGDEVEITYIRGAGTFTTTLKVE
jgi:serine protease Do